MSVIGAGPEVWFHIVYVSADHVKDSGELHEQIVEVALGPDGACENGNIGVLLKCDRDAPRTGLFGHAECCWFPPLPRAGSERPVQAVCVPPSTRSHEPPLPRSASFRRRPAPRLVMGVAKAPSMRSEGRAPGSAIVLASGSAWHYNDSELRARIATGVNDVREPHRAREAA